MKRDPQKPAAAEKIATEKNSFGSVRELREARQELQVPEARQLELAAGGGPEPGAYIMVSVTDSGTGIPQEIQDKIFEPFFTTKEQGKGTGLGLSTVLGIVKSHGGFIRVCSEPGQGTEFKVYFPAHPLNSALEIVPLNMPESMQGKGELILLVDDEQSIREVAGKTLERFGYRVVQARNGAEAVIVYALRQEEISLVITDVSMPIMNGDALIVALRAINPGLRMLVSSGLPTSNAMAKAKNAGIQHFLPKPYSAESLLKALQQELSLPPLNERTRI